MPTRVRTSADVSRSQDCRCSVWRRARSTRRPRRSEALSSTRGNRSVAPECCLQPSRFCWPLMISLPRARLPQNCRRSPSPSARRCWPPRPRTLRARCSLRRATSKGLQRRCGRRARPGVTWRCRTKRRRPVCCWRRSVRSGATRTAVVSRSRPRDGCSSSSTPSRGSRASPSNRIVPASACRLTQRTRGAGSSPARHRQDESRHRRRALHQRKDRRQACEQHLRQAWRVEPFGRDRLGVPAQPHLSAYIEIPNFKAS